MAKRFVVLDGSSLFFRAFYALPPLTDSKGNPTNAIQGFSSMLAKIFAELKPDLMALAFDKSRKTFRAERYPAYKGTRDKTPDELKAQIPLLRNFAAGYGIPFLEEDHYEADDIIGTLSTQAAGEGYDVVVITGDRDALQLIRKNLRVFLTKKGISNIIEYDEEVFREEYGLDPIRLIDLKGLMGDTSDNIPGIKGIGPKTAQKLLTQYGTVEEVLAHAEEVPQKKTRESLIAEKESALLSKELATIELQVPGLSFAEKDFVLQPNHGRMEAFCREYELRSAWRSFCDLFPQAGASEEAPAARSLSMDFRAYRPEDGERLLAGSYALAGVFSGRAPFEQLEALAIAFGEEECVLIERGDSSWEAALGALSRAKGAILYDSKLFCHGGIRLPAAIDLTLYAYLLQPEASHYEVEDLVCAYLPEITPPEAFADDRAQAAWEARLFLRLQPKLQEKLAAEELTPLYQDIERPLVPVLSAMEQRGVFVNRKSLAEKAREMGEKIQALEVEIYDLSGHEFKINSPKQLGVVLFEELGLPALKKTKTGYSTNAEVLESLRLHHPIVEKILAYRTWTKLKSTYLDGIEKLIDPESGRVHTTFNQKVTATGRLSSSDPNLQNIPVRTPEGRAIRTLFEPGEGYDLLLSADYSQIELRVLAHMSGDENFIRAFLHGDDIHAQTASEVFGVPQEEVTPELRRSAKAVNFGIVYGISDFGLARDLGTSRKEAGHYIARYFARYPKIKSFMDTMVKDAHEKGYVTTLFERRRFLPGIKSRNFNQRSLAERMAMNTPIQGTAADIIKLAMIRAEAALQKAGLRSRILLQVHDELVLEVLEAERPEVECLIRQVMENVLELKVPLVVDIHSGKNWAEAK